MAQDPAGALNPRHNVYDTVAEGLRIHHLGAGGRSAEGAMVKAALSRVGLRPPEQFLARYPGQLSGGQCQRVAIAAAIAIEPQVLVADEPVASLDASARGEILQLLLRLRADTGLAVVAFTHDLGLAWNIADRVAVMYLGRFVEIGDVEQVLIEPVHPYGRALVSALPGTGRIQPPLLSGEPADPTNIPTGCRFHPRCPVFASGLTAVAGIRDDCLNIEPAVLPGGDYAGAACHLSQSGRTDLLR